MSTEQNKEIVSRAMAALGRGDYKGFLADADNDLSFTLAGTTPFSGTIQGKQVVEEALQGLLGTNLEGGGIAMTIDNLIAEGEYVAGSHKVTGLGIICHGGLDRGSSISS